MSSAPDRRTRSRGRLRAGLLLAPVAGLALAGAVGELALRVRPDLLPDAVLQRYPLSGIEFHRPGVLDRTPIGELPLPLSTLPYAGGAPGDLIAHGIAPEAARSGDPRYASMRMHIDELGFANARVPERADVVLLGDSFVFSFGVTEPESLGPRLERELGLGVYRLGVTDIGPHQQRFLLDRVGPRLSPRAVLWFVFGGNDLADARAVELARESGLETLGDRSLERPPPLRLLALRTPAAAEGPPPTPLAPLTVRRADGTTAATWCDPQYLALLAYSAEEIRADGAWLGFEASLDGIRTRCAELEAELTVVFLPSKAQLLLDAIHPPADVERYLGQPGSGLAPRMLQNRDAFERLVERACAEREVEFRSATAPLRAAFELGQDVFFTADTHLALEGQAVLFDLVAARLSGSPPQHAPPSRGD